MRRWNRAVQGYFLLFLAGVPFAKAATIVSTFSGTPPGYTPNGYKVSASSMFFLQLHNDWAMQFTVPAGADYQLTGFSVPLKLDGLSPATVDFTVASDLAGKPGAGLATLSFPVSSSIAMIFAGKPVAQPTLTSGTAYWLMASISPSTPNTGVDWLAPAGPFAPPTGLVASRNVPMFPTWSVSSKVEAAYEIDGVAIGGSTVPEPSSTQLPMVGLLALIGLANHRAHRSLLT